MGRLAIPCGTRQGLLGRGHRVPEWVPNRANTNATKSNNACLRAFQRSLGLAVERIIIRVSGVRVPPPALDHDGQPTAEWAVEAQLDRLKVKTEPLRYPIEG